MEKLERVIKRVSWLLDTIACIGMVMVVLITVSNILLRQVVGWSILGASEYVSAVSAVVISFSLARCALEDGHIKVEFFGEKLPKKALMVIDTFSKTLISSIMVLLFIRLMQHGNKIRLSGEVSPTAQFQLYPFIFMVVLGIGVLCLVNVLELLKLIRRAVRRDE
ncbi:TRAP-type C4-dicarboxylate transport system permease small subunit [Caldicoprobacter guelmensis]|uniref:TRAP transporter small permease n=1 Tax=Caldicoprobacter guelmensis TaxID=1170224 RepID=UPI00195C16C3|nr:TRAP transporter small permease [Caldicoprobacter guelmensis]MBM7581859.1 TRAP-type C4-dicarboxylate transport system permease small subunit [Caldicoprobacter guelmensis]